MKKNYISPVLVQEMFETADVITISFVFVNAPTPNNYQDVPEVDVDTETFG